MYDEGLLERCLDAVRAMGVRDCRHKNVFGMRGLMQGKKMFAAVGESGIIVKMPNAEFESALQTAGVQRFMPGGEKLGNWVEVNDDVIADDSELRDWLAAGLRGIR
jgi:hypothetical protein